MESFTMPIDSVPNEILLSILSLLSTRALLPLVAVSHRFYSVTLRILQHRLTKAAALPDHRLILECYHPSAKISTPYLYGDYLYTDSAAETDAFGSGLPRPTLGELGQIYSHFRPVAQEENWRPRSRYPMKQSQQNARASDHDVQDGGDDGGEQSQRQPDETQQLPPSHDVYLDENELFTQLCTVTNLVKVGPKPGLFLSHVNISDGLIRVFRPWLAAQAAAECVGQLDKPKPQVLWADSAHDVGIRFRVVEKATAGPYRPVLVKQDEDLPVAYRLELEELLVRTNRLLLMVEKSEAQEVTTSGKAIVIASI
ncbi:cyclin-like F-box protein [Apodospora peruviana]|uniref:Cyclin-like F-box protein n=1 Tax=Apodospora peruviana TaxID=516989 RepID=A0AAE0LYC9_9PEZI|nr:cyclin-like F-box protein [Apodospora peruviana]